MISIDCEMTGLDIENCAIISVGAVDLDQPDRRIYLEMRPFPGAKLDEEGLAVNGYTEEVIKGLNLSQEEALGQLKVFLDESKVF